MFSMIIVGEQCSNAVTLLRQISSVQIIFLNLAKIKSQRGLGQVDLVNLNIRVLCIQRFLIQFHIEVISTLQAQLRKFQRKYVRFYRKYIRFHAIHHYIQIKQKYCVENLNSIRNQTNKQITRFSITCYKAQGRSNLIGMQQIFPEKQAKLLSCQGGDVHTKIESSISFTNC